MKEAAPHRRFKEARERAGLSIDEVAIRSGIGSNSIYDLEEFEDDLICCYPPRQIQQLCHAVGIKPVELFGDAISEPTVSPDELVRRIREECSSRGITLKQFEEVVGWRLNWCMDTPELLLGDITVEGLQWLCQELKIDWRRVLLSLEK